ncbi:MAG: uracil-DNA glycosylase, partial [Nitrospira sp.]|nr:uracil-DNA glycosylase [Nitrospira sp.]
MKSWEEVIPLLKEGHHQELIKQVDAIRQQATVYPPPGRIFYALQMTPFDEVKVVILGQDPYHGAGQAMGMAFSVPEGVTPPPSLRNIFKEIEKDVYNGKRQKFSPDLTRWAKQGVLLLNVVLTVEEGKANSHRTLGWQQITDQIIQKLSQERDHLVFILWGAHAQAKKEFIDSTKHLVLEAPHPSPLSAKRGFFGSRHFSQANQYLLAH